MKIRVIGCSGAESPENNLTAFLLDDFLLIDAGTIGHILDEHAQRKISHILISHAHLDHIKSIPFFVDNIVINNSQHLVTIISGRDVLIDLRRNIFNDRIWPDFTTLYDRKNQVMRFLDIPLRTFLQIRDYRIHAVKVNHSVPAYGYIIVDSDGNALAYTGDTGPTERIWKRMNKFSVKVLIIETSFPNSMEKLALKSGHLTPSLLEKELEKIRKSPDHIYITHMKPQHRKVIEKELGRIRGYSVDILSDDTVISL